MLLSLWGKVRAFNELLAEAWISSSISRCDHKSFFQLLSFPCGFKKLQIPVKQSSDGEGEWGVVK